MSRRGPSLLALCWLIGCAPAASPAPPVASASAAPLGSSASPSAEAPLSRRAERDGPIEHYTVDLALDVPNHRATGVATLALAPTVASVELEAKELDVASVEVASKGGAFAAVAFEHVDQRLRVALGATAEGRSLRVRYTTRPSKGLVVREDEAYTAFDTRDWLPCDFDPGHKATLDLRVVVPADWVVVGAPSADTRPTAPPIPRRVKVDVPHSAYLFGFAAGRYEQFDGPAGGSPSVRFYAPKTLVDARADLAPKVLEDLTADAALYERWSGRAYPARDFAMVATTENGGQELAFMALGSVEELGAFADDPKENWLLAHELAHAWWGNAITCDRWADFWLNEAFAVFMTAAVNEARFGRGSYDAEVALAWRKFDKRIAAGKDRALVGDDATDADRAGGPIVYSKGALVLFELRAKIGDDAFWDGVRRYSASSSVVRTEDLQAAMERAAGVPLGDFFQGWTAGLGPATTLTRPPQ